MHKTDLFDLGLTSEETMVGQKIFLNNTYCLNFIDAAVGSKINRVLASSPFCYQFLRFHAVSNTYSALLRTAKLVEI